MLTVNTVQDELSDKLAEFHSHGRTRAGKVVRHTATLAVGVNGVGSTQVGCGERRATRGSSWDLKTSAQANCKPVVLF